MVAFVVPLPAGAVMGLSDIDPFVETTEGRAFFPYYRVAPGYLLAPSDELPLKRFLRTLRRASIALFLAALLLVLHWLRGHDFAVLLISSALYAGLRLAAIWVRCRPLPRTSLPMPRLDTTRRAAAALSNDFVEIGQLVCLLFAVGGSVMCWYGIGDPAVDIVTASLFAGYWLWYCRIARIKRTERPSAGRGAAADA